MRPVLGAIGRFSIDILAQTERIIMQSPYGSLRFIPVTSTGNVRTARANGTCSAKEPNSTRKPSAMWIMTTHNKKDRNKKALKKVNQKLADAFKRLEDERKEQQSQGIF